MVKPTCSVVDQLCIAAANFEDDAKPNRIGVCFRCGQDVCRMCSTRRQYKKYGIKRLCNDCQVDEDGHDGIVMRRLRKLIRA